MDDCTRRDAVKMAVAGVAALGAATAFAVEEKKPEAAPEKTRGSAKLFHDLAGKKTTIETAELKKWVEGLEKQGVHIPEWWIYGTPAIDVILGRLETSPKEIGTVAQHVYGGSQHIRPSLDVFPIGIPQIHNLVVQVKVTGR